MKAKKQQWFFLGLCLLNILYLSSALQASRSSSSTSPPFIIEQIKSSRNDRVFQEISSVCVDAFFNDNGEYQSQYNLEDDSKRRKGLLGNNKFNNITPPWKVLQLKYLQELQKGDLQRRKKTQGHKNAMFVARNVIPANKHNVQISPLLLDLNQVYNRNIETLDPTLDYVKGPVIGFVEVTQRKYGLVSSPPGDKGGRSIVTTADRPILTNLSVRKDFRKAGVGSRLLDVCEKHIIEQWRMNEIVLEVEEDNHRAMEFYQKRGYQLAFVDPTSRRYDTRGLWLRQVRCKRNILRKCLANRAINVVSSAAVQQPISLLRKLRWLGAFQQ